MPIVVRGITDVEDALECARHGADAVWVTANEEYGPSPIAILPSIAKGLREKYPHVQVFYSGGVRRGTDVLKALAFGASLVFLDTDTPLWALFYSQKNGLQTMIQMLNEELRLAMVLTHCTCV